MKCRQARERLLERREDAEAAAHILDCAECRSLKELYSFISENARRSEDFSPPGKLADSIRAAAARQIGKADSRIKSRKTEIIYWISSIAAAFVITAATIFLLHFRAEQAAGTAMFSNAQDGAQSTADPGMDSVKWNDIDFSEEINGLSEELEIGESVFFLSEPRNEPSSASEDIFYIEIPELQT